METNKLVKVLRSIEILLIKFEFLNLVELNKKN